MPPPKEKSSDIDLGLAVLSALSPKGHCWTLREIAEVCECSCQNIALIERSALKKLRHPSRLRLLRD